MSVEQLRPDLGPVVVATDRRIPDDRLLNFSACMELARTANTDEGRAFYRGGMACWRRLEGAPITKAERENRAINAALAEVSRVTGKRHRVVEMGQVQP